MAEAKKGGLISRLVMGKEKSEDYARSTLPSNRWSLFWDIFKGRFWKLVLINFIILLFCLPVIALILFRYMTVINYGAIGPFSQGFGVGYHAAETFSGISEHIVAQVNINLYMLMPVAALFAALGIAGGAYVIRNMVWTEGIFVANDFWRGIKNNIKQILLVTVLFSLVFYASSVLVALADTVIIAGTVAPWLMIVSKVFNYIVLIFYAIMSLHMITMSVTYKLTVWQLFRNSFLFTIGMLPQNVFFIVLAGIPFICMILGGFLSTIGIVLMLFFGLSLFLLVWTNFCQWAYDKYINDKVPGAKKNRGIYDKVKGSESEALKQYKEQIAVIERSSLNSRPIKPITDDDLKVAELPMSFNRNDIVRLAESKQAIYDDHARYVEEHKNDPEFQVVITEKDKNAALTEREKRIESAKKELLKRKGKKK